ncbi:MAG: hypothetical protein ACYSP9_09250, partial [Planctomycetota bacterium]
MTSTGKAPASAPRTARERRGDCGKPVKGLVCAVEAGLRIDGVAHVLHKEEHEQITKKEVTGYTRKYSIDEVPTPERKFKEWVASEIISEDVFKMLTNLEYFLGALPWEQVRHVLKEFGGVTGDPEGFEEVVDAMAGRAVKDYQKVIRDRKKGCEKERAEIPAKIQENQRTLAGYAENMTDSQPELIAKREDKEKEIAGIVAERTELRAGENKRTQLQAELAQLNGRKATREGQLASDTSAVAGLLKEKSEIEAAYMQQMQALSGLQADLRTKRTSLESAENDYAQAMLTIQSV